MCAKHSYVAAVMQTQRAKMFGLLFVPRFSASKKGLQDTSEPESIPGLLKSLQIRAQHTECRPLPILIVAKAFKFYFEKNKTNVLLTGKSSEPSANRFETSERL